MELVGLQWNIQAARVRRPNDDPLSMDSYTGDRPAYIGKYLADTAADFITLQEVHANRERDQAQEIASYLGTSYVATDSYGQSFMNPDYDICQSIISKYPIVEHAYHKLEFEPYTPVNLGALDGEYLAKDTGLTVATLDVNGSPVNIITLHMQPFSLFNIDPYGPDAAELRSSLESILSGLAKPWIMQGDFNVNCRSISQFLGGVANRSDYVDLAQPQATIPAGHTIDHVACSGAGIVSNSVDATTLTDHYPVLTRFAIG